MSLVVKCQVIALRHPADLHRVFLRFASSWSGWLHLARSTPGPQAQLCCFPRRGGTATSCLPS